MKIIWGLLFILASFSGYADTETEFILKIESLINQHGIDEVMSKFISNEKTQYPLKKDSLDTITSVYYIKATKAKVYSHILNPDWRKMISNMAKVSISDAESIIPKLMQTQSVNTICSNKLNRVYFKHDVKIINNYSEQNGKFLFSTEVRERDCRT